MPIYDYQCNKCGNAFSKLLKMSDRETPLNSGCEYCNGEIQQVIGCTNIVSGVQVKDKRPEWFKDRLRNLKKNCGKDNQLGNVI